MKLYLTALVVLAGMLAGNACPAAEKNGQQPSPVALVLEKALAADARGKAAERDELLREALRIDPDSELAHWHLGQVYFAGMWRSVESIGQLVAHDPRWQEYRERLAKLAGGVAAQRELARWCRDQGLENEAKWHWLQVLQADSENREALGNLKLRRYRGGFYTAEQIIENKRLRTQAEADRKRFHGEFTKLVSVAERADEKERREELGKLAAVSDAAAIPALMEILVDASVDKRDQEFSEQVCQAVVAALNGMREHEATLRLLEIALFAPQETIRHSASGAMRYREPTDYMPLLMASLAAPVESTFSIDVLPSGHVNLVENISEIGPEVESSFVKCTNYLSIVISRNRHFRADGSATENYSVVANPRRDLRRAESRAGETLQRIAAENATRQVRNQRVQAVLEIAIDERLDDARAWWTYWQEYNELYTPDELPIQETSAEYVYRSMHMAMSCFVAGTPVWTQSGTKPIEQIGVGELVLSQDPDSGRLDYRPVVGTTIRPPTGLVELAVGDEKIVATRGHRFWVTGEGWRMAKFLNPGAALFGVGGSRSLQGVKKLDDDTAYNLVVADNHTYFVGNSRLLVHDNNCPLPTTATVPGAGE